MKKVGYVAQAAPKLSALSGECGLSGCSSRPVTPKIFVSGQLLRFRTRIPGLGVPSWMVAGFDGHEMARIQGQYLVVIGSATSRPGADHEEVDEGAALCSANEGAQDQDTARSR